MTALQAERMTGMRALTILFALALLCAAAVAVMLVGYADLPDPSLTCMAQNIGSCSGTAAWPGVDAQ
jgi:hypothetical protein